MWQVADGLASAHTAGITHRDVKPSNILVTADGQAKLTDFGIARSQADATLTQTGLVTGSPAYLAPEVASGSGGGTASDVWSLGATLFHVLAGKPPYDVSANLIGGLYKIVHEEPPRLPDAGAFDELLRATMAKEPAERGPWNVSATGSPRSVAIPPPPGRPRPWSEPGEAPSATQVLPPIAPAPPASAEDRRRSPWPWLAAVVAAALAVILVVAFTGDDPNDPASDQPTSEATSEPARTRPRAGRQHPQRHH